jgi:RNA polymerase sigma factor (sigma-70 family)
MRNETWGALEIDHRADFERAVAIHAGALFALAYSILRQPDDAEDAVQAAMEHAWRKWTSLREPGARAAWLRQVCVRECLRHRQRRRGELTLDSATAVAAADRDMDLERALLRLSTRQRAVVVLHYGHGYSLDECAGLLGNSPGATRSHLNRALTRMRRELTDA